MFLLAKANVFHTWWTYSDRISSQLITSLYKFYDDIIPLCFAAKLNVVKVILSIAFRSQNGCHASWIWMSFASLRKTIKLNCVCYCRSKDRIESFGSWTTEICYNNARELNESSRRRKTLPRYESNFIVLYFSAWPNNLFAISGWTISPVDDNKSLLQSYQLWGLHLLTTYASMK